MKDAESFASKQLRGNAESMRITSLTCVNTGAINLILGTSNGEIIVVPDRLMLPKTELKIQRFGEMYQSRFSDFFTISIKKMYGLNFFVSRIKFPNLKTFGFFLGETRMKSTWKELTSSEIFCRDLDKSLTIFFFIKTIYYV